MLPGETLGTYRRLDSAERGRRQSREWAARQVDAMPGSWAGRLLQRWAERYAVDPAAGNSQHLRECKAIARAHQAGVPADAGDAELCQIAMQTADDMGRRLDQRARITAGQLADPVSPWSTDWRERCTLLAQVAEAQHWLTLRGVVPRMRGLIRAVLARVRCDRWWRLILRRVHAKAVEYTARRIGLVHKRAGCYVSDDALRRRTAQIERNARALESVKAVNDTGQAYTLAELAARGPANRQIRRHELMTRIAGFELIAKECGHLAYFVTVTCPSRMHAYRSKPGSRWAVEENPKHDGTAPDEAQAYLSRQWARFRPAAERAGLELYGFRIAEPNHDGTPHWHLMLFFPELGEGIDAVEVDAVGRDAVGGKRRGARPGAKEQLRESWGGGVSGPGSASAGVLVRLLRRYFLHADSSGEVGADKHRVKVERIDWTRGSAAGYLAKYVAKNIDGYKVEKDLYGNDCLTASRRVDSWASTWRVRQFQQIGGAPVTIWRELRRVHPEQAQAGPAVALALDAVNAANAAPDAVTEEMKRYTAAHAWQSYLTLQGGHRPRRSALRVRMLREPTGEIGRYGEPCAARPAGVLLQVVEQEHRPALGIVPAMTVRRELLRQVESERAVWTVVPSCSVEAIKARATAGPDLQAGGEAARPWSPVINCTVHPARLFAPTVQRHARLRKWADWSAYRVKKPAGGQGASEGAQRGRPQSENRSPQGPSDLGAG